MPSDIILQTQGLTKEFLGFAAVSAVDAFYRLLAASPSRRLSVNCSWRITGDGLESRSDARSVMVRLSPI